MGVISIADNLIYNSRTGKFILNETKYGVSNTLRRNQKVLEDAVKAGKQVEIRTTTDKLSHGLKQGDRISTIEKIVRSHSIDGTITNNTIKTIWTK